MSAAPLLAWDCRDPGYRPIHDRAAKWLSDHGIDPCGAYRVEFYLVDTPFARVFPYAESEAGWRYWDPATGDAAVGEPRTVLLPALPPAGLVMS